jgi:5,6-dimethylbenzimidazole synthase
MEFKDKEIQVLKNIMLSRRDVRGHNFINKKIDKEIILSILDAANTAPSVGFSQPWKFLIIKSEEKRKKIFKVFEEENEKAKIIFKNNEQYSSLKLEGIKESYINIAVLYQKTDKHVLGQTSQEQMGEYSVVCAIQNLWLMARAYNIGIGWVSILKPKKVKKILNIEKEDKLIAYLTMGYVNFFHQEPELQTIKWKEKKNLDKILQWI